MKNNYIKKPMPIAGGLLFSAVMVLGSLNHMAFAESGHEHHGSHHKSEKTHHDHDGHGKHAPHLQASEVEAPSSSSRWGVDYFPNITLTTQDGKKVKFFDDVIKDKVVAINFIFTSCEDSCPLETSRLLKVQKILGDRVGKDVFMYSITIDPEVDTPAVLKDYMQQYKIGPGWEFLTGNKEEIISLRKKFGLYLADLENNKENPDDHNLNLVIGNQTTGRWMKRSPFENPHVLASQLGDWLHNWKHAPDANSSYENAPELRQISPGEILFRTRCSSCHGFGKEDIGPDLLNVAKTRDRAWLVRWLKEPNKMLEEKDPIAMSLLAKYKIPMPNMRLNQKDVVDIIAYMESEDARLSPSSGN